MPSLMLEQGCYIHYEERGEGRPLLLIHGWCFSSAVWHYQLDGLCRSYRVIAVDLPGHGASEPFPTGFTLENISSALSQMCVELNLNDAILCGWSLGAFVALQLASLLHSRISALVLVGATPRFTRSDDWEYGLTEKAVSGLGISYKRSPRKAMDSFISQMFSKSEIEQIEKIDECQKMFHSIPLPALDVALQGLELLIKSDVRFSLSSVVVPTVVVSGDSDSICLPLASNYLANHLNAELAIFQDAGHAPFLTQSNKFNQYIENFIRRIPHSAD